MFERKTKSNARGSVSTRPNFVFILADDLGYADLHCYGGREDCSPKLDRMATEGLLFTNGYANSCISIVESRKRKHCSQLTTCP